MADTSRDYISSSSDFVAGAAGLVNPLIPIGFEVGKALLGFFGNQEDPEEAYRRRTDETIRYINKYFGEQTSIARRRADRDLSLAGQAGAREAAGVNYAGAVSAFTAPAQSNIYERLGDTTASLNANRLGEIARVKSSGLDLPIFNKPNKFDYLSSIVGAAGKGFMANEYGKSAQASYQDYADKLFSNLNDILSGRDSSSGNVNRFRGGLNYSASPTDFSSIPSQPKDRASRYFNFGLE